MAAEHYSTDRVTSAMNSDKPLNSPGLKKKDFINAPCFDPWLEIRDLQHTLKHRLLYIQISVNRFICA